ncbi:putative uncharacterized protein DDB_G0289263 [Eurosta solidaginis]|uniref:putative uncharacterized protein DDB_G0289263 n=1 Tax=Eurosta solidaginis TaxID=178769 RepID=UPI0035310693
MNAAITTWCSCNEKAQWHYDCNGNSESNNNEMHINNRHDDNSNSNSSNNNNYNSNNNTSDDTQVTFNSSNVNEMRQTHLQRQRELQQTTAASHQLSAYKAPTLHQQQQSTLRLNSEKSSLSSSSSSTHSSSSPLPHRLTRRKRLQRQKTTTELEDVDYAYAADLEEEDEEEDEQQQKRSHEQQQKPTTILASGSLLGLSLSEQVSSSTPITLVHKRLQHFQQQIHHNSSAPFDVGQPSSLPNNTSYRTRSSMMSIHQQHLLNNQLQQHHHNYNLPTPPHRERRLRHEESFDSSTTTTTNTTDTATSPDSPALRRHNFSLLKRDNSIHSDSSSHYSSVDSLLEARKPDPEAILINLGFGPVGSEDILSRIPKRFLKPSQVRGIDTEAFVRRLQLASNLADHSVMGYRGLTGNPDIPPSRIVAKIMQRFEVNERKKSMGSLEQNI